MNSFLGSEKSIDTNLVKTHSQQKLAVDFLYAKLQDEAQSVLMDNRDVQL